MYTCTMGLFCQENDDRSVLLPLNMTSCQMSLKVISSTNVKLRSIALLCLNSYCFVFSSSLNGRRPILGLSSVFTRI